MKQTVNRDRRLVKIVECKKDGENWVYKLEDTTGESIESGKFFVESELKRN